MKTLTLLVILSFSALASAANWKALPKKVETAKTAAEFKALKKKYPDFLKIFTGKNMVKMVVTTQPWKYIGETSCEANDARLVFTGRGVEYCDKQGAAVVCSKSTPLKPWGDNDPCLFPFAE